MRFREHRIGDQRILRLIGKRLKAGILEDGTWTEGTVGRPQGAVISPLLVNVYLHCVYDPWVQQWRNRHALGDVIVIRYADDTIVAYSTRRTLAASSMIYERGWQSLNWNCTLRNPPDPVRPICENTRARRGNRRAGNF